MLSTLPVTFTTVVKFVPSVPTWMLNAEELFAKDSPPAPPCSTTNLDILNEAPRSTINQAPLTVEHHLSLRPPETVPFTPCPAFGLESQGGRRSPTGVGAKFGEV